MLATGTRPRHLASGTGIWRWQLASALATGIWRWQQATGFGNFSASIDVLLLIPASKSRIDVGSEEVVCWQLALYPGSWHLRVSLSSGLCSSSRRPTLNSVPPLLFLCMSTRKTPLVVFQSGAPSRSSQVQVGLVSGVLCLGRLACRRGAWQSRRFGELQRGRWAVLTSLLKGAALGRGSSISPGVARGRF